ncbi:MAG: alpha/beta hydrolase [Gammaproteobacteria bacterium]|nr:alpha/beta hydrolase [Gammaproteobacteria bacterium]
MKIRHVLLNDTNMPVLQARLMKSGAGIKGQQANTCAEFSSSIIGRRVVMSLTKTLSEKLFISACAMTHTTNFAAYYKGAAFFLPALFVLRYANMGGLDAAVFAEQLAKARSFRDKQWCSYWDSFAVDYLSTAESIVQDMTSSLPSSDQKRTEMAIHKIRDMLDQSSQNLSEDAWLGDKAPIAVLGELIAPAVSLFADYGAQPSIHAIESIVKQNASALPVDVVVRAASLIDALVKAITYYQVGAFPGHTPARTQAYWRSRRLFDVLIDAFAPALDVTIERVSIPVDGDIVQGYQILPVGAGPHPMVLVTNGLEGTTQELIIPMLKYRKNGVGIFFMEMPGSYVYKQPMSAQSETIYHRVIDYLVAHPKIKSDRIGMMGVSFGGYWATRMAITDTRLRGVVACGAPAHHTFGPASSLGMPEVIVQALRSVTGSKSLISLTKNLHNFSLLGQYQKIQMPMLVINGDNDTLVSKQDSVDIAEGATQATLKLYPNDDHCAMGHYNEWLDESQRWLEIQLGAKE